jgi:hypothetical protein
MTDGPGSGGYHWRSEEHVAGWDAIRSRLDPLREARFGDRGFLHDARYTDIMVTAQLPRPARKGEFALIVGRQRSLPCPHGGDGLNA